MGSQSPTPRPPPITLNPRTGRPNAGGITTPRRPEAVTTPRRHPDSDTEQTFNNWDPQRSDKRWCSDPRWWLANNSCDARAEGCYRTYGTGYRCIPRWVPQHLNLGVYLCPHFNANVPPPQPRLKHPPTPVSAYTPVNTRVNTCHHPRRPPQNPQPEHTAPHRGTPFTFLVRHSTSPWPV